MMFELRSALLDLDEDVERLSRGIKAGERFQRPFPRIISMGRGCMPCVTISMRRRRSCAGTWTGVWSR